MLPTRRGGNGVVSVGSGIVGPDSCTIDGDSVCSDGVDGTGSFVGGGEGDVSEGFVSGSVFVSANEGDLSELTENSFQVFFLDRFVESTDI